MTMPIQFDQANYIKILTDAGVSHDEAAAHAAALSLALSQPVANDADLTIHRAEFMALLAEMEARLEAKLLAKLAKMLEEMLEKMLEEMLEKKLEEKLKAKLRPIIIVGVLMWVPIVIMQSITLSRLFL